MQSKQRLLTFLFCLLTTFSFAQLPPGSTAPNWTMTDISGVTHTLYDYLDDGKTVFLDFSATRCGPCWNYHNSGALENLYEMYGPDGTDEVMVIMIEAEAGSNTACLYGPSGCNNTTWGNWVAGTTYPIIDNAAQNGPYQIGYFPTIYGICLDYIVTELGQAPTSSLYSFSQCCSGTVFFSVASVTDESCFGYADGAIDLNVSGSVMPFTFLWNNGATTEDISGLPPGDYQCTITNPNGISVSTEPITVSGQTTPLNAYLVSTSNGSCFGADGSIDISMQQFDCSHLGTNEVVLMVFDESGNSHSSTAMIKVMDVIVPVVNCQNDIEVFNCDGLVNYDLPVLSDNCPLGDLVLDSGIGSGGIFPLGATLESYSYTDAGGNTVTCSFTVTVSNTLDVQLQDFNDVCFGDMDGSALLLAEGGTAPYKR
ncbi:MAG: HYR domain-containing protein [Bacteroidota bacterium]